MTNIELLKLQKMGNITAISRLVEQNKGLVDKVAYRYVNISNSSINVEDLQQEGYLGLLQAIEYFDINKGFEFSTYAFYWIKQKITRYISENHRSIRLPEYTFKEIRKVKKAYSDLTITLNRTPSIQEIAIVLNMGPEKVDFLFNLDSEVNSLDKPVGEDGDMTLESLIKDTSDSPEDIFIENEFKETINEWLQTSLNDEQLQVVKAIYGFNGECHTLESIGKEMNVSGERVRQMNVKSLRLLRKRSYKNKAVIDIIVDFKTNFYTKGKNGVVNSVIRRDIERSFQLQKYDHPFYKWHKYLTDEKYKIENKLNIYSTLSLTEIDIALEIIDQCIRNILLTGDRDSFHILFGRLNGRSEEETIKMFFDSKESYYISEKKAINYIKENLDRNDISYPF